MVRDLYIDDLRTPLSDAYDIVRSYDDAVHYMRTKGCPTYITFDHDLGDNVPTGFDVAKWMVERDLNDKGKFIPQDFEYGVHSANPVGRDNIIGLLKNYLEQR